MAGGTGALAGQGAFGSAIAGKNNSMTSTMTSSFGSGNFGQPAGGFGSGIAGQPQKRA